MDENKENVNPLIIELTDENNEKVKVEIVQQFKDSGKTWYTQKGVAFFA